jgi:hypothetical protein
MLFARDDWLVNGFSREDLGDARCKPTAEDSTDTVSDFMVSGLHVVRESIDFYRQRLCQMLGG